MLFNLHSTFLFSSIEMGPGRLAFPPATPQFIYSGVVGFHNNIVAAISDLKALSTHGLATIFPNSIPFTQHIPFPPSIITIFPDSYQSKTPSFLSRPHKAPTPPTCTSTQQSPHGNTLYDGNLAHHASPCVFRSRRVFDEHFHRHPAKAILSYSWYWQWSNMDTVQSMHQVFWSAYSNLWSQKFLYLLSHSMF